MKKNTLSPLAQESIRTLTELNKLLSEQENQTAGKKPRAPSGIYFKIEFKSSSCKSRLTPALSRFIQQELQGDTTPGFIPRKNIDKKTYNKICSNIRAHGLEVKPKTIAQQEKIKQIRMLSN